MESDIESFFTVPDSLQDGIQDSDEVLAKLEASYRREGDLRSRKILALAYIDRKELAKAQALLAPGWGVDLEPDEEIMLLYTDRMLGEKERARVLADQLVAGEASTDNPYIWAMTALIMRDDPRAMGSSLVNYRYFNKSTGPAAYQHSGYLTMVTTNMYYGFSNIRSSFITPDGDRLPMEYPWFKTVERRRGGSGSGSGGGGGKTLVK